MYIGWSIYILERHTTFAHSCTNMNEQNISCQIPTQPLLHVVQHVADWVAPFPRSQHSPPGVQTECRQTKCRTDKMPNRQNVDNFFFFFLQFFYAEKQCGRQFWNVVEHEPVETRVLNPTASEAS